MPPYPGPNMQPGYAQPPPNYGGYNSGYPQRKPPESAHEHPLIYEERLTGTCRNCKEDVNGPGYKCDVCRFILDMRCSDKIFYGEKRKGFHPHPLMLRVRQSWKCDVCKRTFADKCSFFCQPCDFDACDQCYLAY
jgi:hypothetical protein